MADRLTKRSNDGGIIVCKIDCDKCEEAGMSLCSAQEKVYNRLAELEDAEEQRNKCCPMCDKDVMDGNPIVAQHSDGFVATEDIKAFGARLVANFCPMCGRKLREVT